MYIWAVYAALFVITKKEENFVKKKLEEQLN